MGKWIEFKGQRLWVENENNNRHAHEDNYIDARRPEPTPSLAVRTLEEYRASQYDSDSAFESFDVSAGTIRRVVGPSRPRRNPSPNLNAAHHAYAEQMAARGFVVPENPEYAFSPLPPVSMPDHLKQKVPVAAPRVQAAPSEPIDLEADKELPKATRKYMD